MYFNKNNYKSRVFIIRFAVSCFHGGVVVIIAYLVDEISSLLRNRKNRNISLDLQMIIFNRH